MQLATGMRHLGVLLSYPRPATGPGPGQQEPQHGTHRHSYTATVPTNPLSPDLTNQAQRPVALVTGATRGLGRSIAEALASDHHLLIGGREADTVQGVVNALPSAAPFVANLTDEQETERASEGVGRLDVLIHCAGIIPPADVSLRDAWRRVLETNVVAVAHLTDLLLPTLRQWDCQRNGGWRSGPTRRGGPVRKAGCRDRHDDRCDESKEGGPGLGGRAVDRAGPC